jgi:hypothetical protein
MRLCVPELFPALHPDVDDLSRRLVLGGCRFELVLKMTLLDKMVTFGEIDFCRPQIDKGVTNVAAAAADTDRLRGYIKK